MISGRTAQRLSLELQSCPVTQVEEAAVALPCMAAALALFRPAPPPTRANSRAARQEASGER